MLDWNFLLTEGDFNHSFRAFALSFAVVFVAHFAPIIAPWVYRFAHPFDTLVHESSHALTAMLLQCKVKGIKVYFRGGGLTEWFSRGMLSEWIVALTGYPAGALWGSAVVYISTHFHYPRLALAAVIPIALVLLLLSRTFFTIGVWAAVFGGGWLLMLADTSVSQAVLCIVGGAMAAASLAHMTNILRAYVPSRGRDDGGQDWEMLPIPPIVGLVFIALITCAPVVWTTLSLGFGVG